MVWTVPKSVVAEIDRGEKDALFFLARFMFYGTLGAREHKILRNTKLRIFQDLRA